MAREQSFQNHARTIPAFHYFVFGTFTLNFAVAIARFGREPTFTSFVAVLTAAALIVLAFYARVFALTVQDRVIRLEMRERLKAALPAAMHARIPEFAHGQLVALRFASDEELPELADQVLRDKITDRKEIKRLIKKWNADHLRA